MDSGSHALAESDVDLAPEHDRASWLAEFTVKAEALGVRVWHAESAHDTGQRIAEWSTTLGADRIVVSAEADGVSELTAPLHDAGLVVLAPQGPEAVRDAPLGVCLARMAVAETGSILLSEPDLADRSVSMLTLSLAVICPLRALVASLDDALAEIRRIAVAPGSSFATLVTGPSRTADIERVLTVGVQGPGVVAVIFVADLNVKKSGE